MSKQTVKLWVMSAFLAVVAVIGFTGFANFVNSSQPLAVNHLAIITAAGQKYDYVVELAETPSQQETGMMFRDAMGDDQGMLFIYPQMRPVSMWMRNTRIPLDMLFIDDAGIILSMHEGAKPYDETPVSSVYPVKAVLELKGGQAAQKGIQPGDKVLHPAFSP